MSDQWSMVVFRLFEDEDPDAGRRRPPSRPRSQVLKASGLGGLPARTAAPRTTRATRTR